MHAAIEHVYTEGKKTTRDVGGKVGTSEFANAVIEALETSKQTAGVS
jgi:isocitrate/isopropylmalate dehydrogenase